jgi:hypothetical protein
MTNKIDAMMKTRRMKNFINRRPTTRSVTVKRKVNLRVKLNREIIRAVNSKKVGMWENDAVGLERFGHAPFEFVRNSMKTLTNNDNHHRGGDIYYRKVSSESEAKDFLESKLRESRNAVMVRLGVSAVVGKEVAGPAEGFAIEGSDYTQTISEKGKYFEFKSILLLMVVVVV